MQAQTTNRATTTSPATPKKIVKPMPQALFGCAHLADFTALVCLVDFTVLVFLAADFFAGFLVDFLVLMLIL